MCWVLLLVFGLPESVAESSLDEDSTGHDARGYCFLRAAGAQAIQALYHQCHHLCQLFVDVQQTPPNISGLKQQQFIWHVICGSANQARLSQVVVLLVSAGLICGTQGLMASLTYVTVCWWCPSLSSKLFWACFYGGDHRIPRTSARICLTAQVFYKPLCAAHLQTSHQPKQGTWLSQGSKLQTMAVTLTLFRKQATMSTKQGQQQNAIFPIPSSDTSFSGFQHTKEGLLEPEILAESLFLHFSSLSFTI